MAFVAILLSILKIIGIVLLVILGIVLALLLLLLFWPVSYRAGVTKESQQLQVSAKVWWLCHVIHFRYGLAKNLDKERQETAIPDGSSMELYVFGIPVFRLKEMLAERKAKKGSGSNKSVKRESKKDAGPEIIKPEKVKTEKEKTEKVKPEEAAKKKTVSSLPGRQENGAAKKWPTVEPGRWKYHPDDRKETEAKAKKIPVEIKKQRRPGPILRLGAKISALIGKIKKLKSSVRSLLDKISDWIHYLESETFGKAKSVILLRLKKTLKHILPRKIRGRVEFGLDDPSVTGQILGIIAILYPTIPADLDITPDFEEKKFEGELDASGHIVLGYVLYQVLRLILNKDVKALIKRVRSARGGS